jgi:hypothetical protein
MRRHNRIVGALIVLALALAGCGTADGPGGRDEPPSEYASSRGIRVTVETPQKGATVASPLDVAGQVPGSWSFEADFPIDVLDADRRTIGEGFATLKGDWMTEDDVDFAGTITFDPPRTESGFLVLRRANPSGLRTNDDSVEIPIRFQR